MESSPKHIIGEQYLDITDDVMYILGLGHRQCLVIQTPERMP